MFNLQDIVREQQERFGGNDAIRNQLDSILQGISENAMCDASCERDRESDKLNREFIDARRNVATAKDKFNDAEKIIIPL